MKSSIRFSPVKAVAAAVFILAAGPAHAFIVPDTVDRRALPAGTAPAPRNFIINSGSDSLVIDSITASMQVPGLQAELAFYLTRGVEPNVATVKGFQIFYRGFNPSNPVDIYPNSGTRRFAVGPGVTISLRNVLFDFCVACPTAKPAAAAAIGDTLKARVVFHSGAMKDSVLFLSIERISTSLRPLGLRPLPASATHGFYDLTGRRVAPWRYAPGIIPVP